MDNDRGWGLADLKGRDPLDRRVEVEKKENYAQALRNQIAEHSNRGEDDAQSSRNSGRGRGGNTDIRQSSSGQLPASPSTPGCFRDDLNHDVMSTPRGWAPQASPSAFGSDIPNSIAADKVAQVQDLMRQRLQSLQEEQHSQWQRVQALIKEQSFDAREEIVGLRKAVANLEASQEVQSSQLSEHEVEIEKLKDAHRECERFRSEVQREQSRLQADLSSMAVAVRDFPDQLRRLQEDLPRIAARAVGDAIERNRPVEIAVAPSPPKPPVPPVFSNVSEQAFALLRGGEDKEDIYELPKLQNVVGRGPVCDAQITGSQAVSNRHASLDIDAEGRSCIRDLGSRNGTFVNDRRVPEDAGFVIQSGDSVRFGIDGPAYRFEFGPAYFARWPREYQRVSEQDRGNLGARPSVRPSSGPKATHQRRPSPFRS